MSKSSLEVAFHHDFKAALSAFLFVKPSSKQQKDGQQGEKARIWNRSTETNPSAEAPFQETKKGEGGRQRETETETEPGVGF